MKHTSLHAKGPGWRASALAGSENSEEIGYVPKRDNDAACVRFDRKLAASTEGSPTVGGCILGQVVRLGLESIQRHVVTCVVVAVKAEFCVGCVGALRWCWCQWWCVVVDCGSGGCCRYAQARPRSSKARKREAGPRGLMAVRCWLLAAHNHKLPRSLARVLRHFLLLAD